MHVNLAEPRPCNDETVDRKKALDQQKVALWESCESNRVILSQSRIVPTGNLREARCTVHFLLPHLACCCLAAYTLKTPSIVASTRKVGPCIPRHPAPRAQRWSISAPTQSLPRAHTKPPYDAKTRVCAKRSNVLKATRTRWTLPAQPKTIPRTNDPCRPIHSLVIGQRVPMPTPPKPSAPMGWRKSEWPCIRPVARMSRLRRPTSHPSVQVILFHSAPGIFVQD